MSLSADVNKIKKISFYLFLVSILSLIGSIFLNNSLINFKYTKGIDESVLKPIPGYTSTKKINCSKNLASCKKNIYFDLLKKSNKLGTCFENKLQYSYKVGNIDLKNFDELFIQNNYLNNLKPKFENKDIQLIINVTDVKNEYCIKNHSSYKYYKLIPLYYEFLHTLRVHPKTDLGSSIPINPFLYGEASISNIVKRFPINFIFKPLLFIGSILLILYWSSYNIFFANILKSQKNIFRVFGIISAISLFLHVLFLGIKFESEILSTIKRLFIIFFILFEVLAQYFLTLGLFINKKKLIKLANINVINLKIGFLILVIPVTLVIIVIMLLFDLTNKYHYILEWNYFALLIFYYLLSYFMWPKKN
tara:strand:- start:304 stop:1392 length:1089 start_codon:yes stop_codon:yes gene_type:complete